MRTFAIMKHILYVISIFLVLTVLASCTDKEAMRQRLDYVSQCNRADTVFTEAWLPTVDSLVNYFDRHGNANEKMMAHYLKGRVHHDMGESPIALECYQRATEMADTTRKDCDLRTLASVFSQSASLYKKAGLYQQEISHAIKASQTYLLAGDTLRSILCYELTFSPYYHLNKIDSAVNVLLKTREMYINKGLRERAALAISGLVYIFLKDSLQLTKAKHYMNVYENESGLFDKFGNLPPHQYQYYGYKGSYYKRIGKNDSAEYYFRKALEGEKSLSTSVICYHGLLDVFKERNNIDSMKKYSELYCKYNDSTLLNRNTEEMARMQALYNYNEKEKLADKKTIEAERYKNIIYIIIGVGVFSVIVLFRIWRLYERNNRNKILIWNKKYYDTLTQYQNVRNDLMLSFKNFEQYRTGKEKEVEELRQSLSVFLEDKTNPEIWNLELFVSSSSIVKRMHELAYKAKQPSEVEWDDLRQLLCKHLPSFYKLIKDDKYGLSNQEQKVAMLIRLRFIPTELIALLNLSKQRVTNIRSDINHKLFHEKGTKDLDANLMRIK